MIQGSEEWLKARCGVVTASRFNDVLASIKSGEAAARYNYKAEIIAERLTGAPAESYTNAAMQWGTDHESEARSVYEAVTGQPVTEVGLIKIDGLEAGASPDGLVGEDGLVEIKCPNTATHILTRLNPTTAMKKHYAQIQGQLWATNRKWCDLVSYDPRLDDRLAYFVQRIERDEEYIAKLETEVKQFLKEVDELIERLQK